MVNSLAFYYTVFIGIQLSGVRMLKNSDPNVC